MQQLSHLETLDTGKLHKESQKQILFASRMFAFYAGIADKIYGTTMPLDDARYFNYSLREPLGVVAILTAWNSPIQLLANKLAPALAAGNAAVIKPSEHASLSTLHLIGLLREYEVPPGLVNVVTGDASVGTNLVSHQDVQHSSFTGGHRGGRSVGVIAMEKMNSVTLELGGKSPNVVFADADLDRALTGALVAGFSAAGQTCVAGSRLLLAREIKDAFLHRLASRADSIQVGNPFDESTQMGPIGTDMQFEQITGVLEIEKEAFSDRSTTRPLENQLRSETGGNYLNPQVLDISGRSTSLRDTEVFGPVLVVDDFDGEGEAIEKANATPFGLASGLWTRDLSRAHRVARNIEAGTVWVNTYRQAAVQAPFGGYKKSGLGRERGLEAIDSYLQTKNVMIDLEDEVDNPYGI